MFDNNQETSVIIVMDNGAIAGVVVRSQLYHLLGQRLGNDLYLYRSVSSVLDVHPLIVSEEDPIHLIVKKAMERDQEHLYNPVIILTDEGPRTLSIRALLLSLNGQLKDTMLLQADQLTAAVDSAKQLNASFENVGLHLKEHVQKFEELVAISKDSEQKLSEMNNVYESVTNISKLQNQLSQSLQNQSVKLLESVEGILSLSEQINILSLNASIESARAGVHGRGFAVVAEEVRKLAGNTSQVSRDIKEQMQTVFKMVNENSNTTIEGLKEIEEVRKVLGMTKESFHKVVEEIEGSNSEMVEVDYLSQKASSDALGLTNVLQTLYETTRENALNMVTEE